MPRSERERVLRRIGELEALLRQTHADDVRATLTSALEDCQRRLVELDALIASPEPSAHRPSAALRSPAR